MSRAGRRGNHEGSIFLRSDGRWCGQVSLPGGRRKDVYGKTREEAARKLQSVQSDLRAGLPPRNDRLTVGQYLDQWLEQSAKPTVQPRTYESYVQQVECHIKPALGRTVLTRLEPAQVQAMLNNLHDRGLKTASIRRTRAVLRRALAIAMKWGYVHRNVAALVDVPRGGPQFEALCPTIDEMERLLNAIAGHRIEPLVVTAAFTGIRQGELLGLTWDDVDLDSDAPSLHVRRSLKRVAGKPQLGETKNHSSQRRVPLSQRVVESLAKQREAQEESRRKAGDRWVEMDLVFTTAVGTPWDGTNLLEDFRQVLGAAGLPPWRWHDLRHFFGTHTLAETGNPRAVQDLLGHADVRTTLNHYAHAQDDHKRQAVDALHRRLVAAG